MRKRPKFIFSLLIISLVMVVVGEWIYYQKIIRREKEVEIEDDSLREAASDFFRSVYPKYHGSVSEVKEVDGGTVLMVDLIDEWGAPLKREIVLNETKLGWVSLRKTEHKIDLEELIKNRQLEFEFRENNVVLIYY